MNVLVTGGAGFVGTNLIKRLLRDGHDVVSLDNYCTGFRSNHQDGCQYFDIDITDSFDLQSVLLNIDIGIVYHLAALARVQPSIKNPTSAIKNNFDSTLNILEWARKDNVPVVFAGSSSFHHGLWGSPYAWSKHAGEQLCKLYSNIYDLSTTICRFYNVYGPHQLESGTYATVIGIFEKQYREGRALTVTGNGEQRRDFTHIEDIVDGLIKCMEAMHGAVDMRYAGEIFELGRGVNHSIIEITEMFGSEIQFIPGRPCEYDMTLADYSKANKILDWNPTKNLPDYIEEVT